MTAWSQIQRAPARTLPLPPEAFSDSFRGRPSKPLHVGLRTIAMLDLAEARLNAAQVAVAAFPEDRDAALAVDTYNDELIAWIASSKPSSGKRCVMIGVGSNFPERRNCDIWLQVSYIRRPITP